MKPLPLITLSLFAAMSTCTLTAQVKLTEVVTVSLASTATATNPEYVGSNPAAIAWDGTDLYVAGYNNSPNAGTVAIAKVTGALTPTPVINPAFGTQSAPGFRGYINLDIDNGVLAAAFDNGGVSPNGIATYDSTGALVWTKTGRGSSGIGFDPGFFGIDSGVGWTTFGSTRRALQDATTGADIYDSTNGMVFNPTPGTFWRDLDFNDRTGDMWLRKSNKLVTADRAGGNLMANAREVADFTPLGTSADFVAFQNVAVMHASEGSAVIFNDRWNSGPGQNTDQVCLAVRLDGTPEQIDWGTHQIQNGNGAYDFSYDEATETLALLDFTQRTVTIFQVEISAHYDYGPVCAGAGGFEPKLQASGSALPGTGAVTYSITEGEGGSLAFIFFGFGAVNLPLQPILPPGLISPCNLLISPLLPFQFGPMILTGVGPGTGVASSTLQIPSTAPVGLNLTAQGLILEASTSNYMLTNGVWLQIP